MLEKFEDIFLGKIFPLLNIVLVLILLFYEIQSNQSKINDNVYIVDGIEHHKCTKKSHSLFNESYSLSCKDGFNCVNCSYTKHKNKKDNNN